MLQNSANNVLVFSIQRHQKLETSLKGFEIAKYVPSEIEIKREMGEIDENKQKEDGKEDNDCASDEENIDKSSKKGIFYFSFVTSLKIEVH